MRPVKQALTLGEAYAQVRRALNRRARHADEPEDLLQDACIRLLSVQPARRVRSPLGYLQRTVRNLLIDRHRRRQRARALFDPVVDAEQAAHTRLDPERILASQGRLRVMRNAIECLPPRCAQALKLHRFEHLSYVAIARRMGISAKMVEKHMAEAMRRLRLAVDEAEGAGDSDRAMRPRADR